MKLNPNCRKCGVEMLRITLLDELHEGKVYICVKDRLTRVNRIKHEATSTPNNPHSAGQE